MKKLRVFINPGVHPQFKEIIDFPPKGVKYVYDKPKGDHNSPVMRKKRQILSRIHTLMQFPRIAFVRNAKKYDLLHSTRGIIPLNHRPWIVDIESGAAFASLKWVEMKKPLMRWLIRRYLSSPYCKKIIPQSEAAKKSLLDNIDCSGFEDNIETVYLAYRTTKLKRKKSSKVRISFIGRGYFEKGGHDTQQAFQILDKKYPGKLQLKMKCNVPEGYKLKMKNVIYLNKIDDPKEFYEEIFGDCDIYVQPTTIDSFGVSILEAMSTGLPIVCTDDFTLPEMVEDGHNGFLVKSPVNWYPYALKNQWKEYSRLAEKNHPQTVKELVKKISILIENPRLRKKMGQNSFKMVESGKFSIRKRNEQLRRIYDEAIRN